MKKVLIIGAGASGLSCAKTLSDAGVACQILEARDRIGGRIWTFQASPAHNVELGAEFIHGAQKELIDLLERHQLSFEDLLDHHLERKDSDLKNISGFWEKVEKVNALLNPKIKKDRSMQDFLIAHRKKISTLKDLYVSYLEGFQAMDLHLAGEKGLAESEKKEVPELNGQSQFRPLPGYSSVMEGLFKDIQLSSTEIHFEHEVQKVLTDPKNPTVVALNLKKNKLRNFTAPFLVLALPVGVLKSSLYFDPPLPDLTQALRTVEMGHALRITFQFKERFWESLSKKPVAFLHIDPREYFPTWWTQMPRRTPFLTAWQGGPKAFEISHLKESEQVQLALQTLSKITDLSFAVVKKYYVNHFMHNWTLDPYSRGAYSYVGVHEKTSWKRLQKPFHENIYLAGEALSEGADRGTVQGALKSGREAAEKILRRL
nr:NAD(P)/FAD-dependent oxidoreductase [uncultured Bdellovibrio sp.]